MCPNLATTPAPKSAFQRRQRYMAASLFGMHTCANMNCSPGLYCAVISFTIMSFNAMFVSIRFSIMSPWPPTVLAGRPSS